MTSDWKPELIRSYGDTERQRDNARRRDAVQTAEPNCRGCRYWSVLLSRAGGAASKGAMESICLNAESPNASRYVVAETTCLGHASGPPEDLPF